MKNKGSQRRESTHDYLDTYLLLFILSCGDHFNPDGASHGGPQDTDRVSVGLGWVWA
jgi:hypothetical protein